MKLLTVSLGAVTLVLGAAMAAPPGSEAAAKCEGGAPVLFADAPEFVLVLDGKLMKDEDALDRVDRESIESVSVACPDALYRVFGVKSRAGGTVVFTKPGPFSALQASLATIAALQQAHQDRHGGFATDLAALGWSDPSGQITAALVVSEDGSRWSASASHRLLVGLRTPPTVSGERAAATTGRE